MTEKKPAQLFVSESALLSVIAAVESLGSGGARHEQIMAITGHCDRYVMKAEQILRESGRLFRVKSQRWVLYFASDESRAAFEVPFRERQKAEQKAKQAAKNEQTVRINRERRALERAARAEQEPKKVRASKPAKPRKSRAKPKPASLPAGFHRIKPVKADPFKTAQAVIPEGVKVTVCPPMPDRFAVSGPVVGGFATMRPGQYLPADTWASRLVAA